MRIVLDIETNTKHDHIWLVVTKDIDTGEVKTWKAADGLKEFLEQCTLIVMQNGVSFDAPLLNRLWKTKIRLSQCFDTLLVSRLLDPSREGGHSLEAWGETLGKTKVEYRKIWNWIANNSESKTNGLEFDNPHMPLLEHYCIGDVEVTALLYQHLIKELAKHQFSDYSVELEHRVAAIIAQQERNGFRLDLPYATTLLADIQGKLEIGRAHV